MTNHPDSKRLNKAISDSGFCSRRQADKLIEQGRVSINDQVATLGDPTMPGDEIKINGQSLNKVEELVYIALNKPVGMRQKLVDISQLEALGWTYKTELIDGITQAYEFYKEGLNNGV